MTVGWRSPLGGPRVAGDRDVDLLLARDPVLWRHWERLEEDVDR